MTSSWLPSEDADPGSPAGLLRSTRAGWGCRWALHPPALAPRCPGGCRDVTDVTRLPTLSILSWPYRPGTPSNRVLAGPPAPNSWWVMCTPSAITALAGLRGGGCLGASPAQITGKYLHFLSWKAGQALGAGWKVRPNLGSDTWGRKGAHWRAESCPGSREAKPGAFHKS